jgi:osmotically-inducible protein OsmY
MPANQGNGHVIVMWLPFNLESTTMNIFKGISTFLVAITMMFMLGCASTTKHEGTGEYVDDTVITTKVKTAILEEPGLKSAEINVETFKGVVQLSGFVSSRASANKAAEIARGVRGVKSVKDDMRVK